MYNSPRLIAEIAQFSIGEKVAVKIIRGSEKQDVSVTIGERPNQDLILANLVTRQSNLIAQFAILGLDVNEKVIGLLPPLRMPAGVVVAAKVSGMPSPGEEFQPGDLINSVNGDTIENLAALRAVLDKLKPGAAVAVHIQRGEKLTLLAFELP